MGARSLEEVSVVNFFVGLGRMSMIQPEANPATPQRIAFNPGPMDG